MWDKLVLKKVRNLLGGRVRMIVTGSAPIAVHVLTSFELHLVARSIAPPATTPSVSVCVCVCVCVCVQVIEGYGQTEITCGCSSTLPHDVSAGHVGPPLSHCTHKLVDVPDMDYFASRGEGEVASNLLYHTKLYLPPPSLYLPLSFSLSPPSLPLSSSSFSPSLSLSPTPLDMYERSQCVPGVL